MIARRSHFGRSQRRKLMGLLLLSMCASVFPLPTGSGRSHKKDQSQPFPCQNRPCGCASADQCWKQCCCFTNAEKLVWARKNGVTPPQYVVEAAQSESNEKLADAGASQKSCCSHSADSTSSKTKKSCCDSRKPAACCEHSGDYDQAGHKKADKSDDDRVHYVIVSEMMKCRGQGHFWNALPWAVIPVSQTPTLTDVPKLWEHPQSVIVISVAIDPPEPPPRLA